jgi:hypoxanthine-guanine phosphoribosyltransferase
VLVDKLERPREVASPDYVGFEIERGWVVGFGMDLKGEFRDLDEIGVVENDD